MYRQNVSPSARAGLVQAREHGREHGQASFIIALGLALLLLVCLSVLDIGLVEAANQRVAGYAQQTAQAGVEAATVLNGFGTGASNTPLLNPTLATQQAQAFFQALNLGPTYQLTIVVATSTLLTVRIQTTQEIFLWPGPASISASASETPQADTAWKGSVFVEYQYKPGSGGTSRHSVAKGEREEREEEDVE
jgi:hypothetical protein